jgi:RHS repeat-associated protein
VRKVNWNTYELTFPPYETYATLVIMPFDDAIYEGNETATTTVVSNGSAYTIHPTSYQATVTIYDNDTNTPPTAEAGGPYSVDEGGSIQLNGTNSYDPDQAGSTLTYAWDLDGDGIYGEASTARGDERGAQPTFSAAGLSGPSSVTVSLRVTDDWGAYDTDTATIAIRDPGVILTPSNDELVIPGDTAGGNGDGNHSVFRCITGLGCYRYGSDANPHPTVAVDAQIEPTNGGSSLSSVEATLNLGGIQKTVYYDGAGVTAASLYRMAIQVDGTSLATGRYDWTMTVTQKYANNSQRVNVYSGKKNLVNAALSPFGRRWGAGEYQTLTSDDEGVLWLHKGTLRLFANNGAGGYTPIADPLGYWTLAGNWSTGFTLTHSDGAKETFNTSGLRTKSTDRAGNETTFTYTGGKLTRITYPGGRYSTLAYDGNGYLDYVDDFAGRRTDFTIDSNGQLQSIAMPDPDGPGGAPQPTYTFHYTSATGMMDWMEDPQNVRTRYVHDSAGLLASIEHADGTAAEWSDGLTSVFSRGLKYVGDGTGTSSNKAPLTDYLASNLPARRTHSANPTYDSEITVDRFGQATSIVDVYGNTTLIERNANGQVTRLVEPDPDGTGPQVAAETAFAYDARGNMLTRELPDGSVETWTYHATHNVATSYTLAPPSGSGEPTLRTVYTVDSTTGNVTRERQIKNLDDSLYPTDATANPDIVIDYAYTVGSETGTPPKGLLKTVTFTSHPDQPVTSYEYNAHGELTKMTLPDPDGAGPLPRPVTSYAWNSDGTLASVTETDAAASFSYTTNYEYYQDGKLKKVLSPDPDGAGLLPRPVVEYAYNADGSVSAITETTSAAGAPRLVTSYTYADGQLASITYPDPDGAGPLRSPVTEMLYSNGLLTGVYEKSADPSGPARFTQHVYDEMNRVRKTVYPDPDGAGALPSPVERYYFDGAGRMYRVREQTTNANDPNLDTDYTFDVLGRVTSVKRPDPDTLGGTNRPTTSTTYFATGHVKTVTDPVGAVTSYVYNDLGQLAQVTLPDPDGAGSLVSPITRYQYDAAGRRTRQIQTYNAAGAQELLTQYTFDALDRITAVTLPDPDDFTSSGGSNGPLASPVTSYAYSAAGDLASVTDPRGYVTAYVYDALHRTTREIKDNATLQAKTRYFYDTLGNLSRVQDPELRNVTYEYDALRRTTKKTVDPINWNDGTGSVVLNPAGLDDPWSYQYDVFGNLSRVTDPLSHYTTYDYDALDRLTRTTLHNGADTVLEYDTLGNLKKVTDPVGNVTSYTSDYLHRRRSEQTSFGTESYLYDLAGNLIWKQDRLDQITRYDFDKLGRVVQERWKNTAGTTIRTMPFTYDNLGRLVGAADATSSPAASYGFVYDALGRVTQATHAIGGLTSSVVVDQAFDAGGNRTQLKAKVGAANDFVNNYAFDALNRVTQITQQSQTGGNPVAAKRIDLAYDASDRLSYIWRYSSLDTSEYVGRVKYIAYDKAGRLTDMKYDGGGITTIDYDVRYNEHLLDYATITTASAVTIDFGYDTVDQVNSVDYTGTGMPADVSHTYDDAGNRTNTGYSTGAMNRLASDGVYNYQYDARGNRTLRTKISDNTKTEYTWDHRNRLTGVKFKSAGGTVTKEVQYSYDAFNRLVRRRLDADGAGAGGFTDTFWVYDGDQAILEFSNGAATAPSHRYLWGPAVDQILADEQVATGSPNDVRWPLADWQGTIRDVATYNAATNVTTIANHKVYEAFGKVHSESGPTVDTIFGFTGRYFDDDTGLQWNLNRWYDPGVGRWLSEDPIGFAAGDPNLYRYVGNSPGMFGDPDGLYEVDQEAFAEYTERNYRKKFHDATPDAPKDWPIHHTKQDALRDRYRKIGINVDHPKYLRSVPPDIHAEIGILQQKWRSETAERLGIGWRDFYKEVPLAEVETFEGAIDQLYKELWIPSGKNQARRVQDIRSKVSTPSWLASFKAGFPDRMKGAGLKKLAGFAFLALFSADKACAAWDAATCDPRTDFGFQAFIQQYQLAVDEIMRNRHLSANRAHHLRHAWYQLASRFGTAETQDAINVMDSELGKYIDSHLH